MTDLLAPATDLLVRLAPDVEVSTSGDGRTVTGILAPYDQPARVDDGAGPYTEAFARGAFEEAINGNPGRVKFLPHHNRTGNPLGRATLLRDDAAGLYGELYVSRTEAGDEVLQLIRDGALDAFSLGFIPRTEQTVGGVVHRTAVRVLEASIVTFGAYPGALVSAVRSNLPNQPPVILGEGVGESSAEDGSGDPQGLTVVRTGMTPNERERAIAIANLRSFP